MIFILTEYKCKECTAGFEHLVLKGLDSNDLNTCPSCRILNSLIIKDKRQVDINISKKLADKLRSAHGKE